MNRINMNILSTQEIRSHFPALKRTHKEHPVAYFDGPGGTQVPTAVVDAVNDYLLNHNGNSGWEFPSSLESTAMINTARQTFAEFLNAQANEVIFGANMTTLTFHLSRALATQLNRDDEILVTELDHHANIDPWLRLKKEFAVIVKTVKFNPESGQLDWQDFEDKLSARTKIVAIGAASNALGSISDVKKAARLAHAVGALVFVDAVHYAAHHLIDIQHLECDFLACSPYKFYGPHIGILFGRYELIQQADFPKLTPVYDTAPYNAETGTSNFEGIMGAAAAVDFLASLATGATKREKLQNTFNTLEQRGHALLEKLWNGLAAMKGITLYGPPPSEPRTSTLAFTVADFSSEEVSKKLAEHGLFTSHGDFYASTVVTRLGLHEQGLVRIGCSCYTTEDEIERLLQALAVL